MRKLLFIILLLPLFATAQIGVTPGIIYVNSVTPFIPTDTTGCLLWLDANSLGLANNDPVASWTDLSGNGDDADQASGTLQPLFITNQIDGKPVIRFDGTDDVLDIANTSIVGGNTGLSVFVVVKQTSLTINKAILCKWDYSTQGTFAIQTDDALSDETMMYVANGCTDIGGNNQSSSNADLTTTFYLLEYIYDGTEATSANRVRIYKNGTLLSIATVGTLPTSLTSCSALLKIGRFGGSLNRPYNGDMAFILMYDHTLTTTGRTTVETYIHSLFPTLW